MPFDPSLANRRRRIQISAVKIQTTTIASAQVSAGYPTAGSNGTGLLFRCNVERSCVRSAACREFHEDKMPVRGRDS